MTMHSNGNDVHTKSGLQSYSEGITDANASISTDDVPHISTMHNEATTIELPSDLEARTYEQFDQMVRKGCIYYDQVEPEWIYYNGFQFEFRIVPSLQTKPVLAADDPRRKTSSNGGPFIDPNPDEVICDVGPNHRLMLNKFCLYRPMLVLPTKEYAPQSDDLDTSDVSAAWAVLQAFSSRRKPSASSKPTTYDPPPLVVIYNGGVNGGSSQGHKHLQLFPLPADPVRRAAMWPAQAPSTDEIATEIPNVPFKHFALKIPSTSASSPYLIVNIYNRLLRAMREVQRDSHVSTFDYNVIFSSEWMALIPRTSTGGLNTPMGTSAAGMLGLVAVGTRHEREQWGQLGYTAFLEKLGIPIEL